MSKPVILISPDVARNAPRDRIQLNFEYQKAVADAGGLPLVVSPFADVDDLADLADGWLITGGSDMPGSVFGEETHPEAEICHPMRLANDQRMMERLGGTQMPILGICFGMQFLAVTYGGALEQHLPDNTTSDEHRDGALTQIKVVPDSRLSSMGIPPEFDVLCFHHQAVKRIPDGWKASAHSADGTIEAVEEGSERFRHGVQWHPERTADSKASRVLFTQFVRAASVSPNRALG